MTAEDTLKTLRCSVITGLSCDFVAQGKTRDEARKLLEAHGREHHREELEAMAAEERQKMIEAMNQYAED